MYRRLLRFLRPHSWRMAGTIACNVVAAALDAFSLTLLIPFLNALFKSKTLIPGGGSRWVSDLQQRLVGPFLDAGNPLHSVEVMIVAIMAIVAVKNFFVWLGGQF